MSPDSPITTVPAPSNSPTNCESPFTTSRASIPNHHSDLSSTTSTAQPHISLHLQTYSNGHVSVQIHVYNISDAWCQASCCSVCQQQSPCSCPRTDSVPIQDSNLSADMSYVTPDTSEVMSDSDEVMDCGGSTICKECPPPSSKGRSHQKRQMGCQRGLTRTSVSSGESVQTESTPISPMKGSKAFRQAMQRLDTQRLNSSISIMEASQESSQTKLQAAWKRAAPNLNQSTQISSQAMLGSKCSERFRTGLTSHQLHEMSRNLAQQTVCMMGVQAPTPLSKPLEHPPQAEVAPVDELFGVMQHLGALGPGFKLRPGQGQQGSFVEAPGPPSQISKQWLKNSAQSGSDQKYSSRDDGQQQEHGGQNVGVAIIGQSRMNQGAQADLFQGQEQVGGPQGIGQGEDEAQDGDVVMQSSGNDTVSRDRDGSNDSSEGDTTLWDSGGGADSSEEAQCSSQRQDLEEKSNKENQQGNKAGGVDGKGAHGGKRLDGNVQGAPGSQQEGAQPTIAWQGGNYSSQQQGNQQAPHTFNNYGTPPQAKRVQQRRFGAGYSARHDKGSQHSYSGRHPRHNNAADVPLNNHLQGSKKQVGPMVGQHTRGISTSNQLGEQFGRQAPGQPVQPQRKSASGPHRSHRNGHCHRKQQYAATYHGPAPYQVGGYGSFGRQININNNANNNIINNINNNVNGISGHGSGRQYTGAGQGGDIDMEHYDQDGGEGRVGGVL